MSTTPAAGHACCSFIPPYMLEHIAGYEHNDQSIRDGAQRSLNHGLTVHEHRLSRAHSGPPAGSGFIPGFILNALASSDEVSNEERASAQGTLDQQNLGSKSKTTEFRVKREIYDANHTKDYSKLPGKPVTSDAHPATESIERVFTDCFENFGKVYKFYADVFKRDSIDDKGLVLIGSVHFGDEFQNAFWDEKQMVFGDGGTFLNNFARSLDVVGHELTHGVTQYTAGLEYKSQSGALNESISDVFGSMINQYASRQTVEEADWLIGEECVLPDIKGLALRSMKAPGTAYNDPKIGKDPQPAHMKDYKPLPEDDQHDYGGVHLYSGIPNRAFFLTATGLGGHSWEKAGPIWYKALTGNRIKSSCKFAEFAQVTCDIAKEDYGEDVAKVVKDAWTTVGVLN